MNQSSASAIIPATSSWKPILEPGRNCWRSARAERASVLVDAAAYYDAFARAALAAREQILIVGWDFNAQIRLWPGEAPNACPAQLGDFLLFLLRRRSSLRIYVLAWDYSMLYAFDREWFPRYRLGRRHRRLEFRLDGAHPLGAAHHQKVVAVDDQIAFAGGLDFGAGRLDAPQHRASDRRRVDPWGASYPPFHDVQMCVSGPAAGLVAQLARERWRNATGRRLRPVGKVDSTAWPNGLRADFEDVDVAVARTLPAFDGRPEVREIEALYLDAVRAARRFLYFENQYLASMRIAQALEKRLREPDPPEVVFVTTRVCQGWLEEKAMGARRVQVLRRLQQADVHRRLRVYHPVIPELGEARFTVHSKLLIADDRLLRVGSANLNNRSMGLDTECDLAVEAEPGREATSDAIAGLRHRLLAEHLGTTPQQVERAFAVSGSLLRTIDALNHGSRHLEPIECAEDAVPDVSLTDTLDPERPVERNELMTILAPPPARSQYTWLVDALAILVFAVIVSGLWQPLTRALELAPLVRAAWLNGPLSSLAITSAIFVVAGLLMVPVTLLTIGTLAIFGPWPGLLYGGVGAMLSASVTYGAGRALGARLLRRLHGARVSRLRRDLSTYGTLAITALRLLPLAPFALVNVIAGACRVDFRSFFFGTAAALVPGLLVFTALIAVIREPAPLRTIVLLSLVLATWWIQARLRSRVQRGRPSAGPA